MDCSGNCDCVFNDSEKTVDLQIKIHSASDLILSAANEIKVTYCEREQRGQHFGISNFLWCAHDA